MNWSNEQRLRDKVKELEAENEQLEDTHHQILTWCKAYPLDIFPEPDFKLAREGLKAVGITIDAVSASNMRHVLRGIESIIETNSQP